MTVLLWLLAVAIVCDAYFLFVPVELNGGPLGSGPFTIAISPLFEHLRTSGRLLGKAMTAQEWVIEDLASAELSSFGSVGTPWASTTVVALAIIVSMIIGSTTARRPKVEFGLKQARARCIVAAILGAGLFASLTAGAMGMCRIGVTESLRGAIETEYLALRSAMHQIGTRSNFTEGTASSSSRSSAIASDDPAPSLLTDIRGTNGRPILFLAMMRMLENSDPGIAREHNLTMGLDRLLMAEQRMLDAQYQGTADSGVSQTPLEQLLPLYNKVSSSNLNGYCLVSSARLEADAAVFARR